MLNLHFKKYHLSSPQGSSRSSLSRQYFCWFIIPKYLSSQEWLLNKGSADQIENT